MVPKNFTLTEVVRNENSRLFRKYAIRKAELQQQGRSVQEESFGDFGDVLTTRVWEKLHSALASRPGFEVYEPLDKSINEWFLFHGTTSSAAEKICGWLAVQQVRLF